MTEPNVTCPQCNGQEEEWRALPDFENLYEVSTFGRIRSIRNRTCSKHGKVRKPNLMKGYPAVNLSNGSIRRKRTIHVMVAEVFLGSRPNGKVVNHKDGNKLHNHLGNLEYITNLENMQHASLTGLLPKGDQSPARRHPEKMQGELNGFSKLTNLQAQQIKDSFEKPLTKKEKLFMFRRFCEQFNISRYTIWEITSGRRWKHLRKRSPNV